MPSTRSASIPTIVELVEEVEEPQGQELNYESLTVAELKKIATEKGIQFDAKIKKAELIEKLG